MPVTHELTKIGENCLGNGSKLGFPNVSSCTAVVCVLDGGLIGGHFTQDAAGDRPETALLCQRISQVIAGNPVHRLIG